MVDLNAIDQRLNNRKYTGTNSFGSQPKSASDIFGYSKPTGSQSEDSATSTSGSGSFFDKLKSAASKVGNAVTSSEQGFGKDIAKAFTPSAYTPELQAQDAGSSKKLIDEAHTLDFNDPRRKKLLQMASDIAQRSSDQVNEERASIPSTKKVLGDAGGVALDAVTAGTLAKGTSNFVLTPALKAAGIIEKGLEAEKALSTGEKVAKIAKTAAKTSAVGAATGYGYDVTQGLQKDESVSDVIKPGFGTAVGGVIPAGIGAYEAGKTVIKDVAKGQAPRLINSLIKPLLKDFSYGKNPGRAVAEAGITGNSLEELGQNISSARKTTGGKIGAEVSMLDSKLPQTARLNLESSLSSIDLAMDTAAKQNNHTLLQRLSNVKTSLLENLARGTGEKGEPIITSLGKRDLKNSNFTDAFNLKKEIGDMTQWTGNKSDDEVVNKALKEVYGNIKETMNATAERLDPQAAARLRKLNEQYADLTSAEVATKYRDKLSERQNMISIGGHIGAATGIISAILTGGATLPIILAGVAGATLDKVLGSTAVKTRIASFLAKEGSSFLEKLAAKNPEAAQKIYQAFTKNNMTLDEGVRDYIKNPKIGLTMENVAQGTRKDVARAIEDVLPDFMKGTAPSEEGDFLSEMLAKSRKEDLTPGERSAIAELIKQKNPDFIGFGKVVKPK